MDLRGFLWAFGLMLWILLQPNLSNVVVIMVIFGAMLWISGLQLKHVFIMGLVGILAVAAAFPFLEQYQRDRVLTFIFPP